MYLMCFIVFFRCSKLFCAFFRYNPQSRDMYVILRLASGRVFALLLMNQKSMVVFSIGIKPYGDKSSN